MRIDNTMFSLYSKCPKMYWERYEATDFVQQRGAAQDAGSIGLEAARTADGDDGGRAVTISAPALPILGQSKSDVESSAGIELDAPAEGRDFGTRMHQLLHERRLRGLGVQIQTSTDGPLEGLGAGDSKVYRASPEWPDEAIEAEAQATLAAYEAHYIRDYEYLESERTHSLALAICTGCGSSNHDRLQTGRHRCQGCGREYAEQELVVKLDAVVRHLDGTIGPFDTKTESRSGYNDRESWSGRTQAKIYLWALGLLYPAERVSRLVVDVVQRGSPKARRGPIFTRLDDITSSPAEIAEAIRNVMAVAEDIEHSRKVGWWRSNMNLCKRGWERCDYFWIHVNGRTSENLKRYRAAENYLDL